MWKDFFYFSKGQRVGIIILLLLIITIIALNLLLPHFYNKPLPTDSNFITEVEQFNRSLVSADSLRRLAWQQENGKRYKQKDFTSQNPEKVAYLLFHFNPNLIDSTTFIKLGIKPYVVSNIIKYRKRGGFFKTKESFGKVYGINPEKYIELEPYIIIPIVQLPVSTPDTIKSLTGTKHKSIIVELNTADTSELMEVKGIGRGYAKGIVRFRKQTGGFVSVDQLLEIYGMTPGNFEKIKSFCSANISLVERIKVNTASVERLNLHPYLDYYQSKAIYELRRKKGKLKNINDLNEISELTPENILKIQPYLSFE